MVKPILFLVKPIILVKPILDIFNSGEALEAKHPAVCKVINVQVSGYRENAEFTTETHDFVPMGLSGHFGVFFYPR